MTNNTRFIVVLDDGETFTSLEGARIVEVTEECLENILENDGRVRNLDATDGIVGVYEVDEPQNGARKWAKWWDSVRGN